MTTAEAKAKVATYLCDYLSPEALGLVEEDAATGWSRPFAPARSTAVYVDVIAYNSKVYYVQGAVGTPGRLPITGNETVLDALNYAGGVLPSSENTCVRLVRPSPLQAAGRDLILAVDLQAIVERGEVATNYQVMPGDRVVVTRDPIVPTSPVAAKADPKSPADVLKADDQEARLKAMEQKLDLILKRLEGAGKP